MFTMTINKQRLYYANLTGIEKVKDENGMYTGEKRPTYTTPVELYANISAGVGQLDSEIFGTKSDYTKTVVVDSGCDMTKGSILWVGIEPTSTSGEGENTVVTVNPYNYTVIGEAKSLNSTTYAIKEVVAS